jgi:RNA polymerase sigma-70 factor (ECF subfamily)
MHNNLAHTSERSSVAFAAAPLNAATAAPAPDFSSTGVTEDIVRWFWRPVYAFIRHSGFGAGEAQQLTSDFILRFASEHSPGHPASAGKLRVLVLSTLQTFLSTQAERAAAVRAGAVLISIEEMAEEECRAADPMSGLTPAQVFDRRWAQGILERVVTRLRAEYADLGKVDFYDSVRKLQQGERGTQSYAYLGAKHGISEAAMRSAVYRLRMRHQELLGQEIARTVLHADLEDEIQYLSRVLAVETVTAR